MKKLMAALCAVACAVIVGCTLTMTQKIAIARQAGIASAVTWRGVDNPSADQIATAKQVATLIRDSTCTNCSPSSGSYYATLYPLADDYITEHVKPEQQPMARLGAAWLLSGIDTYFAMNPESAAKQDEATQLASAFCDGFITGLNMAPTSAAVRAAQGQVSVRVKLARTQ